MRAFAGKILAKPSLAFNSQFQRVCGARNAWIVIAHGLLALPRELLLRQFEVLRDELTEITLDDSLVLRCRRNNLGIKNRATVVNPVAMV
jgi:hypothetical protein